MNIKTKSASHMVVGNAAIREKMCKHFEDECGALIEEFGCVVIDDISRNDPAFIDFKLAMRQTYIMQPISDLFLDHLQLRI